MEKTSDKQEIATLAGGCFWCTEAIFQRLKGVTAVVPGYAGGNVANPSYEQVCSGQTGHAEAIQITFDTNVISYTKLLEIFFHLHNPTTLNQQGNDYGMQYRSAIFYYDEKQKQIAEKVKKDIDDSGFYPGRIVTEITPFTNFYPAENYHQQYYEKNKQYPYCQAVIDPKIRKLLQEFKGDVKEACSSYPMR